MLLDRDGPSLSFRMLIARVDRGAVRDRTGAPIQRAHYEVLLRFHDIENLTLQDFAYQNVVSALELSEVAEQRVTSGKVEQRIKVQVSSLFGATCTFTCNHGTVVSLEETKLRLGDPFDKAFSDLLPTA